MPKTFVISPEPIRREMRKTAHELLKLKKTAPPKKKKKIELELKVLKDCFDKLGNVRAW